MTFTATVRIPGTGTPTGTVTFYDGATALGSRPLDGAGRTTLATAALSVASHAVTVMYEGDANCAASTSPAVAQVVRPAVPANDAFAARLALTGTAVTTTGTTVNATREPGEPAHAGNGGGKSAWWTWTAPAGGRVTIDTLGSSFDTLLAVYTGAAVSTLSRVTNGSNNDSPASGTQTSRVTFAAAAGATYQIAVDGYNGRSGAVSLRLGLSVTPPAAPTGVAATNGTDGAKVQVTWTASAGATAYEVWRNTSYSTGTATKVSTTDVTGATRFDDTTAAPGRVYWYWVKAKNAGGTSGFGLGNPGYRAVPAPVNDSFDNRIGLSGSAVTTTGTNAGATKEAGEPVHAGNGGGRSVWWSWTAPSNGAVTIDTLGSSFNTLLAVYTGSSLSGLTRVPNGSNDDRPAGGTRASKVTFAVTAGTVYQIAVDGYYGLTGTVALNIKLV